MCFLCQNSVLAREEEKITKLIKYAISFLKNQVTFCYLFKIFPKARSWIKHLSAQNYTHFMCKFITYLWFVHLLCYHALRYIITFLNIWCMFFKFSWKPEEMQICGFSLKENLDSGRIVSHLEITKLLSALFQTCLNSIAISFF